ARLAWTEGAVSEYASAAAFAALLSDLLAARAPVDLVGMAGEFVADEMLHTELNARMATELGGGAPYLVDWSALAPPVTDGATMFERAIERAVRLCRVGETLSAPLLAATARAAAHPLTRAVLSRIAREEPPHARLGWLVLEWAGTLDGELARRLVAAAVDTARDYESDCRA